MSTAVNESWWLCSALKAEAEGYQLAPDNKSLKVVPDDNPNIAKRNPAGIYDRNGGLVATRRVELAEDNMLYRFAERKYRDVGEKALLPLLNSPWWMEEDRMVLLLTRARTAGVRLAEMARRQLALPTDWTDCDILVRVRPQSRIVIASYAGRGRTAASKAGDTRIVAPEAPHLFMDQLYLPGLGRHAVLDFKGPDHVKAWFDITTVAAFDPAVKGLNP